MNQFVAAACVLCLEQEDVLRDAFRIKEVAPGALSIQLLCSGHQADAGPK